MSQYSELMGSFIRTGNFPIEADYIFESQEQLEQFYSDKMNKTLLHKGWFKIVDNGDTQSLYWVTEEDGELKFSELISEKSIDEIKEWLSDIQTKLDKEIANEKEDKKEFKYLEDAVKAIIGSDEDAIKYLQTLDYKNLTEISNELNKFLNTYDEEDESINTFPELKEFLAGYDYKHNLHDVLEDLWNRIEGDPTPNLQFRTLRGIQDFVTLLESELKHSIRNLHTELDQTQIGVGLNADGLFSPDQETTYLKNATSVMNALRTLDSLINQAINNCNLDVKNTESVELDIRKETNKTTISAQVKLSPELGNDLQLKSDGLYHNIDSEYENGILTIKVNGNIRQQHNLGLSTIVENAYYDTGTESIVMIFKLHDGEKQTINIPVTNLIQEWIIDNSNASKVVELEKTRVVDGPDKLSADVRLSSNKYNILEKDGNTLLVKGLADNIVYNGDVTVKSKLDQLSEQEVKFDNINQKITEEVNRAKIAEQALSNDITKLRTDVETKDQDLSNKISLEKTRAEAAESNLESKIESVKENVENNISTQINSLQTELNNEVQRSTNEDSNFRDQLTKTNTDLNTEILRATGSESSLSQRIDALKDSIDNNFNNDETVRQAVDQLKLVDVSLKNSIDQEVIRAKDSEKALDHRIDDVNDKLQTIKDNVEGNVDAKISTLQDALNQEVTRSIQEDADTRTKLSELSTQISNETTRAKAEESVIRTELNSEKERATQREDFIDSRITDHINNHNNPHQVTADQINAYTKDKVNDLLQNLETKNSEVNNSIKEHLIDYGNPHKVTAEQVGLGKVDNTSDLEKPVSLATQNALNNLSLLVNNKAEYSDLLDHISDHNNPHNVSKEQLGLNNVDNTSDINKPISLATQLALDKKSDIGHTHVMSDIEDLENLPIIKGFVDIMADLPENAVGGDKYILTTKVGSGATRYTLCEYNGGDGTWKQKLLTTGGVASVINGDVWKLNSEGIERVLDVSDYRYFYNKIYDETKNLIEDIDWEATNEGGEDDPVKNQIRLKITYKTSYSDPNEDEATNPYVKKAEKYIDIEKARFLSLAYSRPATQRDVNDGYAIEVGEPVLVLEFTTGNHAVISLRDALNIYDPIDTASIDMSVSDWTGNPDTAYKVSAEVKIATTKDKETAVSLHVLDDTEKGMYATLHTSNTNCIQLNPSTGSGQKTLSATLVLDNSGVNNVNNSNIILTKGDGGLYAEFVWGEYD